MTEDRALFTEHTSHFTEFRALSSKFRALSSECRALSPIFRVYTHSMRIHTCTYIHVLLVPLLAQGSFDRIQGSFYGTHISFDGIQGSVVISSSVANGEGNIALYICMHAHNAYAQKIIGLFCKRDL